MIAIGTIGIVTTLLPLLRFDSWWVRIFDFPRVQIAVVLLADLILYLALTRAPGFADNLFLGGLILCLAYQGFMMFPFTRLARKQVQRSRGPDDGSSLSLLFANVLQDNGNAAGLIWIIENADPDVILVVETNKWWKEQLSGLETTHPFSIMQPQDDTYGMMLYSRFELVGAEVKFLIEDHVPSIHGRVKLPSGLQVVIRCLHPPPPFPTVEERSTERDAEILLVGKEVKELDEPIIVFGDLNDVAWSRTNNLFRDVSGLLDPRIGRGFYNTFHARYPFMRFPLDHCFHSNHFRLVDFKRLDYYGSDHFPVYIKLNYEPDAEFHQEETEATESQEQEAREKIQKKLNEDQPSASA